MDEIREIQIPGLEIGRELGHGAYSIVLEARHGDQPCALKLARRRGSVSRWFRREAAALARVRHPGIPRVFEVGTVQDRAFLVMELVVGEPLYQHLARTDVDIDPLSIGIELTEIVLAVHSYGLVHRDISPHNVVVTESGELRLVDFGLVSQLRPVLGVAAGGTRGYSAPEQLVQPHGVDPRADLYSIGRVLEDCIDAAGIEPGGLRDILDALEDEDPEERYHSAEDLLEELKAVARGELPAGPRGVRSKNTEPQQLVGRSVELDLLRTALAGLARGKGRCCFIEGAAGSGKSRLLEEFMLVAEAHAPVLWARGGGAPLSAVRSLILDLAGSAPGGMEALLREIPEVMGVPAMQVLGRVLQPEVDQQTDEVRHAHDVLVEAAGEMFLAIAKSRGGLVVCIDDAHALDPLSREVLVRVALGATEHTVLFTATMRPVDSGPRTRFRVAVASTPNVLWLKLPPWSQEAVGHFLASFLNDDLVDPQLVSHVTSLCDGTPLGVLEVTGALIDGGALRPRWGGWQFDAHQGAAIPLPHETGDLLRQKLACLSESTMQVLEFVAVATVSFDTESCAVALGVEPGEVELALAEARSAGVVTRDGRRPRFVHDLVPETIHEGLCPARRRALHQQVAESLTKDSIDVATQYIVARHYARGEVERTPVLAFESARRAAHLAANDLDHEGAVEFFELAAYAAALAGRDFEVRDLRALAESQISIGVLDEALRTLELAIESSRGVDQADALARVAWVHASRAEPTPAWEALERAFAILGDSMPTESPLAVASTILDTLQGMIQRGGGAPSGEELRRIDSLCELHYQNARLGVEYNRPVRVLVSVRALQTLAARLELSAQKVRTRAYYGALMAVLGRRRAAESILREAEEMGARLQQPSALAYVTQMWCVAAFWNGDMEAGFRHSRAALTVYGPWVDTTDFCQVAVSARGVEAMRGRPLEALRWLKLARDRALRQRSVPEVYSQVVAVVQRADEALIGREPQPEEELGSDSDDEAEIRGFHKTFTWGARVSAAYSRGELGEIERIVAEFNAAGGGTARPHVALFEYHLVLAHVRLAACLRPSATARERERFEAALKELRKARRLDLFQGHVRVLEAALCMLHGHHAKARQHLRVAHQLGERECAPWVLSMVARVEAHLLRREGREASARDRAKVAMFLATEHSAFARAVEISKEFGLESSPSPPVASRSRSESTGSHHHQLRALLKAAQSTSWDQEVDTLATAALDELLDVLGATRGLLHFHDGGEPPVTVARVRGERPWEVLEQELVGRVQALRSEHWEAKSPPEALPWQRTIALPLQIQERVVGGIYVERDRSVGEFSEYDVDALWSLASQVSVALQLARSFEVRRRLEAQLRKAHRMEAVAQVSSGVAYDFSNVLTSSFGALDQLERLGDDQSDSALNLLRQSLRRASEMTHQLMAFSRRQMLELSRVDVRELLADLMPIIRRMLAPSHELVVSLPDASLGEIRIDRNALEQAVIDLVLNAKEVTPEQGRIEVRLEAMELDESWIGRGARTSGAHVVISVHDQGEGMSKDAMERVFEPFSLRRPESPGTGLGLPAVYGFVKQSGGHIEVDSEPGEGTMFTLYFALLDEEPENSVELGGVRRAIGGIDPGVILLVESERGIRQSIETSLRREGYWVLMAAGPDEALQLVRAGGPVDLMIVGVDTPLHGVEVFADELAVEGASIPVLLVSGSDASEHVLGPGWASIRRPFEHDQLIARVRDLLSR